MTLWQAIVLGAVQGLTEFLPVSSSGHLIFFPRLFGWVDQGAAFDAVLHIGTLLALVMYFRAKLLSMMKSVLQRSPETSFEQRLFFQIAVATIPAALVGFFFGDAMEASVRSPVIVAVNLIFWGLVLGAADWYSSKHENIKTLKHTGWRNALFIGCAQAIALLPGVSRSGITMTAGLFARLDKKAAAEFSFLLSIPIIALAGGSQAAGLAVHGGGSASAAPLLAGFLTAAISGWLAIDILLKVIQRWSFMPFVIYRILVGGLILLLLV